MVVRKGRARLPDTEWIQFNGVVYTRRPGRKYYKTNRWDRERKRYYAESLHQAIWKYHNGPIPPGSDVHHKDGDHNNNVIGNLCLLTRSDHAKEHNRFAEYNGTEAARKHLDRIRSRVWDSATFKKYTCRQCGSEFESRHFRKPMYCKQSCAALASYHRRKNRGVRP